MRKKKICFVSIVSAGMNYGVIPAVSFVNSQKDIKDYFLKYYEVSTDYIKDIDSVDYLIVPTPSIPFYNEKNLPIIRVPKILFATRDFDEIKAHIDNYFANIQDW